jgi:pre-mRNA-processing factor 39
MRSFLQHVRLHLPFPTSHSHPLSELSNPKFRLFERGAESCGQDFLAHPFWDKFIEFEERLEEKDHIFDMLSKIIRLPLHQYSRYFERYNLMTKEQPIEKLASAIVVDSLRSEISQTASNPADVEREVRTRIEAMHWEIFTQTQAEVTDRWKFEGAIKRPYYHVTELDEEQLNNWGKYLDYEEAEGNYERTKFLYERCLVTAANYDEIWFRYARWLAAQEGKHEEVRNVYQRASSVYIPIAQPAIRLYYANFEESQGRSDVAVAIHEAILMHIPSHLETIKSLVNLNRRQYGVDAAIDVLRKYSEDGDCTQQTRGALVAEWARILWRSKDDSTSARNLFESTQNQFLDSQPFWSSWLLFEIDQPSNKSEESIAHGRIKGVHELIRHKSTLPPDMIKILSSQYTRYLEERGGKEAMSELLKLDAELNGPASVQNAVKA